MNRVITSLWIVVFCLMINQTSRAASAEREMWKIETLDNGLTVMLKEVRAYPVVTVQIFVNCGARMESEKERGMSHFLEHMLFNGCKSLPSQEELNTAIQAIGGRDNAGTSREQTSYFISVPSENHLEALRILTDMVNRPLLTAEEFEREREVVLEEINLSKDHHSGWLFNQMMQSAFEHHAYAHPVLGYAETLKDMTVEDMRAYHARFYVPGNMVLLAAGDFDSTELLSEIRRHWRDISAAKVEIPDTRREDKQDKTRRVMIQRDVETVYFEFYFKGPALTSGDFPALQLMSIAAGDGESSRLTKRLKNELALVSQIGSYVYGMNDASIIDFGGRTDDPAKLDRIAEETSRVLNEILRDGLTKEELEKAKRICYADRVFQTETTLGTTSETGHMTVSGGLDFAFEYDDRLEDVTLEEVKDVARRYLVGDMLTVGAIIPEDANPSKMEMKKLKKHDDDLGDQRTGASIDFEKLDSMVLDAVETPAVGGGARGSGLVWSTTLDNGMKLILKENSKNPVVAISLMARGGLGLESEHKNGVAQLTQNLLVKGTTHRTAEEIAGQIEEMGGSIGSSAQSEYSTLSASFLAEDFEKGMEIIADIAINSTFPEEELIKARDRQLTRIRGRQDDPYSRARILFKKALFGEGHPFGDPALGSEETVAELTREDVLAYYRAEFDPARMVISISGDVSRARVLNEVSRLLGALPYRGSMSLPPAIRQPLEAKDVVDDPVDREQVMIMLGNLGPGYDDEDLPAFQVMNTVFGGGSNSRLFTRLRGEEGLAYSVYSSTAIGSEQG